MAKTPVEETQANEAPAVEATTNEATTNEATTVEATTNEAPAVEVLENEVEILFIVSPTGKFNLAYNVGETCLINANQANELVEAGFAELVTE